MANIVISDLRPAGADLFTDSESFLYDLTDDEQMIQGGRGAVVILWTAICVRWGSSLLGMVRSGDIN